MRKWFVCLVAFALVLAAVPAIAKPPEGKGNPKSVKDGTCVDLVENHGAMWELDEDGVEPYVASAPDCFDVPEAPRTWTVAWKITEGQGTVRGILVEMRSEIFSRTTCDSVEIVLPTEGGSLTLDALGCVGELADGSVIVGMTDVRAKGGRSGEPVGVEFTVEAP